MRLYSTNESARRGEVSVLAIVETLLAMGTSVWIAVRFDTWIHVAVGGIVAPLLLLRTDVSCIQPLRWASKYRGTVGQFVENLPGGVAEHPSLAFVAGAALTGCLMLSFVPLALVWRVTSTVLSLTKDLVPTLRAIPVNWWRTAIAVDSHTSPEWLPLPSTDGTDGVLGVALDRGNFEVYTLVRRLLSFGEWVHTPRGVRVLVSIVFLPFVASMFVLGVAYRWSVKSTGLVWFALLWNVGEAKPPSRSWETHLAIESELRRPRFVGVVSGFCLALLALKYLLWAGRIELAASADAWHSSAAVWFPGSSFSGLAEAGFAFIRPGQIPLWQIATFCNSILGLWAWRKIRYWMACYKHDDGPDDAVVERTLGRMYFLRRIFSAYVIVCNGYIAIQLARKLPFPEFGSSLFPWV